MELHFKDIFYPLLVIQCSSIILHILGIYLLHRSGKTRKCDGSQPLFLVNLSIIDIMQLLVAVTTDFLFYHKQFKTARYLEYVNYGLYIIYVFYIISLTCNRFFEIYLNIHYDLYCNKFKTKSLMAMIWFLGAVCSFALITSHAHNKKLPKNFVFLSLTMDTLAVLISIITNGYILARVITIQKHQRTLTKRFHKNHTNTVPIKQKHLKKSNAAYFLVTSLVLSTFFFLLTPNLIVHFMSLGLFPISNTFVYVSYLLYAVGLFLDAMFYILLYPPVKNILRRYITRTRHQQNNISEINGVELAETTRS